MRVREKYNIFTNYKSKKKGGGGAAAEEYARSRRRDVARRRCSWAVCPTHQLFGQPEPKGVGRPRRRAWAGPDGADDGAFEGDGRCQLKEGRDHGVGQAYLMSQERGRHFRCRGVRVFDLSGYRA